MTETERAKLRALIARVYDHWKAVAVRDVTIPMFVASCAQHNGDWVRTLTGAFFLDQAALAEERTNFAVQILGEGCKDIAPVRLPPHVQ